MLCIQTDGAKERVSRPGLPPSLAVPLPPEGWLAVLPAVPATWLVDAEGRLVRTWFGELDESSRRDLVRELLRLGS